MEAHQTLSLIVLMGVAGSGKTTVGRMLAKDVGWLFLDGDDYHPPANLAKLSAGVELTEDDRAGWLRTLNSTVLAHIGNGDKVVLACSALKAHHREMLVDSVANCRFVYLRASPELCRARLMARSHFFSPDLLPSQFTTLEEPSDALVIDASAPARDIVAEIRARLLQ